MQIQLQPADRSGSEFFRTKLLESFEQGVLDRFGDLSAAPVPSGNEIFDALDDPDTDVFFILADGIPAGGTIVKREKEKTYSLEILFIFKEFLNKKIGSATWQAIEQYYPDAEIWETCTPYFERRNIHFYVNKCGFKIVEFYCEFHREEHDLADEFKDKNSSGFFRFEKKMK